MRLSHDPLRISAAFDDPNLVSRAGLVPVMALAERAGLERPGPPPCHDRRQDRGVPGGEGRPAWSRAWPRARTRSTTWTCCATARCRSCSAGSGRRPRWGRSCARSPGAMSASWRAAGRELLAELARQAPLLPGADVLAFVDIDSMQRRVYGHKKQGAAFGHTKIRQDGAGPRAEHAGRRRLHTAGRAGARGDPAARRQREHRPRRRELRRRGDRRRPVAGCTGTIVARADSGFYNAAFIAACRRAGACFSVTARMDPAVTAAIAAIPEDAWTAHPLPAGDLG